LAINRSQTFVIAWGKYFERFCDGHRFDGSKRDTLFIYKVNSGTPRLLINDGRLFLLKSAHNLSDLIRSHHNDLQAVEILGSNREGEVITQRIMEVSLSVTPAGRINSKWLRTFNYVFVYNPSTKFWAFSREYE
jgi:hypothetical protein